MFYSTSNPHLLTALIALVFNFNAIAFPYASRATAQLAQNGDSPLLVVANTTRSITAQTAVLGVILILIGLLFLFFGLRLFKVVLFVAGFYFGSVVAYIALSNAEPVNGYTNRDTVLLLGSLAVGIVIGLLFLFVWRLGLAAIGALGGFMFALFLLSWKSNGLIQTTTERWIFIGVLALVGAIVILFAERILIIVFTSFAGSFSVLYGIDLFAQRGFVDSVKVFLSSPSSPFTGAFEVDGNTYGYLAGVIALTLVGIAVQFKLNQGREHREKS